MFIGFLNETDPKNNIRTGCVTTTDREIVGIYDCICSENPLSPEEPEYHFGPCTEIRLCDEYGPYKKDEVIGTYWSEVKGRGWVGWLYELNENNKNSIVDYIWINPSWDLPGVDCDFLIDAELSMDLEVEKNKDFNLYKAIPHRASLLEEYLRLVDEHEELKKS